MRVYRSLGFFTLLFSITFITGCSLGPGEGGTASITGKVKILEYNGSGILVNEYYAPDEDVYIIYGDGTIQSDEVRTSYEGTYRFDFLRKGDYRIFAYSDCPLCDGQTQAVITEVTISKNGDEATASEIIIEKY